MNYLRTITALLLAMTLSLPVATAQYSFDANRMNRDLNIMENILQEMFKTQRIGSGSTHYVVGAGSLFRTGNIRGTYLPGYGVIFLIPDSRTSFFSFSTDGSDESSLTFVYRGDSGNETKVTEETITQRIKEFLRDYGSTIGQLSPHDKIMVLYGANRDGMRQEVFVFAETARKTGKTKEPISTLSVVASKRDLDAYRSGSLSAADFDKRVSVSKVNDDEKKKLDMEVLANIFETAFRDAEEKSFRIHGHINHLLLDNFGALYFFDASFSRFNGPGDVLLRAVQAERRAAVALRNEIVSRQEEEKSEAEQKEELKRAYATFVKQLKEYLVDYGRTLSSVKSDQMVLLSVSLNRHFDSIPERIDIQIKKSALEAMDQGSASRESVLDQVVVREY